MSGFRRAINIFVVFVLLSSPLVLLAARANGKTVPRNNIQFQNVSVCLNRVNLPEAEMHWLYIPTDASELHTEMSYYYLAGQLITSGAVNASTCPAGGLSTGGYANACGMSVAQPVVFELQNAYDGAILQAWQDVGIPPVLLKQLIRYESQFWPGPYGLFHYGLGHLTFLGAEVALLWNYDLYSEMCGIAYNGNCAGRLIDDILIGTLMGLMNATCPTCSLKVDIPRAQTSVHYIAEALLGFCAQTSQLIYNSTGEDASQVVDYATIWKLALLNYNGGSTCVYNYVGMAREDVQAGLIDWGDVVDQIPETDTQCLRGAEYADNITAKFFEFTPGASAPLDSGGSFFLNYKISKLLNFVVDRFSNF